MPERVVCDRARVLATFLCLGSLDPGILSIVVLLVLGDPLIELWLVFGLVRISFRFGREPHRAGLTFRPSTMTQNISFHPSEKWLARNGSRYKCLRIHLKDFSEYTHLPVSAL